MLAAPDADDVATGDVTSSAGTAGAAASGTCACATAGTRGRAHLGWGSRASRECRAETEVRAARSARPKNDAQPNGPAASGAATAAALARGRTALERLAASPSAWALFSRPPALLAASPAT